MATAAKTVSKLGRKISQTLGLKSRPKAGAKTTAKTSKKIAPKTSQKVSPKERASVRAAAQPTTSTKAAETSVRQALVTTLKAATVKVPRTSERSSARSAGSAENEMLGLPLQSWAASLRRGKGNELRSGKKAFVFVMSSRDPKATKRLLDGHLNRWQTQSCLESEAETQMFQGANGPLWIIRPVTAQAALYTSPGLEKSNYAKIRDAAGALVAQIASYQPEKVIFEMQGLSLEEEKAVVLGLELASYAFAENRNNSRKPRRTLPQLLLKEASAGFVESEIRKAGELGVAMNIARHLTNLPGGDLNPRTYADAVSDLFANSSSVTVDVWQGEKLEKENMNLLAAVGRAAAEGPRLVHLRYRPETSAPNARPVAIVGKGVTFDSGGLDIKPSSGMRNMRKDMGGSAAAVALVRWAEQTQLALPLDVYLSLAENAVSGNAFRPGDIITARNGMTVEISNTDAEGRLVMADALDVAVTQEGEDRPQAVIDISTLTGAIKVGLGVELAGLFSNSEDLANQIFEAGSAKGDYVWRMPLFQPYRAMLRSTYADCMNCSEGGFGGAITAALFLELFVKDVPWAHLDIYAWRDAAGGAWAESGGSGQPVQALAETLTRMASVGRAEEMA